MTIKLGDIALAPNKYEAYVYRFTNSDNGKIYIGFHKGSTVDKYQHSSRSKEFNEAFANPFAEGTTVGAGRLQSNANRYYRRVSVTNLM